MTWPTKTDFVDGDVLTATQVNNIGTNLNIFDPTSATAGQLLQADGAGSAAFATITSGGYTQLATGSLSGSSSTVVSGLDLSTYKMVQINIVGAAAGGNPVDIRGNSTSSIYQTYNFTSGGAGTNNNTNRWVLANGSFNLAYVSMLIWNAGISAYKNMIATASITGDAYSTIFHAHGHAGQSTPWTQLEIRAGGTFTAGTYYIYGVS